ncbi:MAG: chemotaxis protein CheD [Acidiferrobacterales bacterium]
MLQKTNLVSSKHRRLPKEVEGLPLQRINIGCVKVSKEPVVFDTVLGSCISVCMYDPDCNAGGMNHFMLPKAADLNNPLSTRYGVHAMELLINNLIKIGGVRSRFIVKVFGGGHVLDIPDSNNSVPSLNINFVGKFLATEKIKVITSDLGGKHPKRVLFFPHTGKVYLKRLGINEATKTITEESVFLSRLRTDELDGIPTLF